MKKIMLVLLIAAVNFTAAYAGEEVDSSKAMNAFNAKFTNAEKVRWSRSDEVFKAEFSYYGQEVCAFYSLEGEFMALIRNLDIEDLPLQLMKAVHEKIQNNYKVADLFEMNTNNGTSYFVRIENATSIRVLKSSDGDQWVSYDNTRKKRTK